MSKIAYSTDLNKFAEQLVWFDGVERRLENIPRFLAFLLAKNKSDLAYKHAKEHFGFTDNDFREALKTAPAGLFMYEDHWLDWNKKLCIEPHLPFPKRKWFCEEKIDMKDSDV